MKIAEMIEFQVFLASRVWAELRAVNKIMNLKALSLKAPWNWVNIKDQNPRGRRVSPVEYGILLTPLISGSIYTIT
jgi:hypothetical protein